MIDIPSADAPVDAPRGRVLLIEDEPNIATAIGFLLQREGWRVSTHSDGRTALDAVARRTEWHAGRSAGPDADRQRPDQGSRPGRGIGRQPVHDQAFFEPGIDRGRA